MLASSASPFVGSFTPACLEWTERVSGSTPGRPPVASASDAWQAAQSISSETGRTIRVEARRAPEELLAVTFTRG